MTNPLVIVGDVLLDHDVHGSAKRLSPDGPAPVVETAAVDDRPGGAGLAALLAAQYSREVVLIAPIAADEAGARARSMLAYEVELIELPATGTTPEKTRVRCAGQSLLRLDSGGPCRPTGELPRRALEALEQASAVLVADYGGGTPAHVPVRAALERVARRVPVVWDPHPRGGSPVTGVCLATPNESEAEKLAGPLVGASGLALLEAQAAMLCRRWRTDAVAITRGGGGALVSYGDGAPLLVPVDESAGVDTCGAGDSFSVAAAMLLGEGHSVADAVLGAARAASAFVAAGGVARLGAAQASRRQERRSRLGLAATSGHNGHGRLSRNRGAGRSTPVWVPARDGYAIGERVHASGGTVVATGGCFDLLHAGHVELLRQARRLGDCLIVFVNSDESVRRLKGPARPVVPEADRVAVLEGLASVDGVVVFDEDTPAAALQRLRPHLWVKGGDYAGSTVPEVDVLRQWGGRFVVLPQLQGRSTTRLIWAAVTGAARLNGRHATDRPAVADHDAQTGERDFEFVKEAKR